MDKSGTGPADSEDEHPSWDGGKLLPLKSSGTHALEAWFLGPKAENAEVLEALVLEALRDHVYWRRNFHPGDPSHITEAVKRHPNFLLAQDRLTENFRLLLAALKKSVPFFSMRYQGHMNWELTLPGLVGYFAAMLYNPNNVALEASTATTFMEIEVGKDLCKMLGYASDRGSEAGAVTPWGHITCDGTVANIEALWAARNAKYLPLAIKLAVEQIDKKALAIDVNICGGSVKSKPLRELTQWELLNIRADDALKLKSRLQDRGIDIETLTRGVEEHAIQSLGLHGLEAPYAERKWSPVVLVTGTKHYSFPKAVALLGLGSHSLIDVPVDEDARMDTKRLKDLLEGYRRDGRPVLAVVCVMGSTEEGAVDDLIQILDLREEFRNKGMDFHVHADAAWGGYHVCSVREDGDVGADLAVDRLYTSSASFAGSGEQTPLSSYVQEQLLAMKGADSITVDPHKSGFIPYPAGALCYRNGDMRDLVSVSAPYILHGEDEPTVGIYGVEGSKPGAAAASVFLSHSVIRPSKSGYGTIIDGAMLSCRKLYCRLLTMASASDAFRCIPVPRLPSELTHAPDDPTVNQEREQVRELDRKIRDTDLDAIDLKYLAGLGPDLNILTYAFNFKIGDQWNRDLHALNKFNAALYTHLSIEQGHDIYDRRLVVSTTDFTRKSYGDKFFDSYLERLDVDCTPQSGSAKDPGQTKITVLRSVIMDPWITETHRGGKVVSFLDLLEGEFRRAITEVLKASGFH